MFKFSSFTLTFCSSADPVERSSGRTDSSSDSKRGNSLQKSSSDGRLINFFRRASLTSVGRGKSKSVKHEKGSDGHDLKKSPTAEDLQDDKINKAFRTGTGPLILVPQQPPEKKPKKPVHNVGIQQIPYQQAAQIIKDHKKLRETLFNEVPISPKSTKCGEKASTQPSKKAATVEKTQVPPAASIVDKKEPDKGKEIVKEEGKPSLKEKQIVKEEIKSSLKEKKIVKEEIKSPLKDKEIVKEEIKSPLKEKEIVKEERKSHFKEKEIVKEERKSPLKEKEIVKEERKPPLGLSVKKPTKENEQKTNIKETREDNVKKEPVDKRELNTEPETNKERKERHIFSFKSSIKKQTNTESEENKEKDKQAFSLIPADKKESTKDAETNKERHLFNLTGGNKKEPAKKDKANKEKKDHLHSTSTIVDKKNPVKDSVSNFDKKDQYSPGLWSVDIKESVEKVESNKGHKERHIFGFAIKDKKDSDNRGEENRENKERYPSTTVDGNKELTKESRTNRIQKDNHPLLFYPSRNSIEAAKETDSYKERKERHILNFILDKKDSSKETEVLREKEDQPTPVQQRLVEKEPLKDAELSKEQRERQVFRLSTGDKKDLTRKLEINRGKQDLQISEAGQVDHKDVIKEPEANKNKGQNIVDKTEPTKEAEGKKGRQIFGFSSVINKREAEKELETNDLKDLHNFGLTRIDTNLVDKIPSQGETDTETKKGRHIFSSIPNLKSKPPVVPKTSLSSESKVLNQSDSKAFKPTEVRVTYKENEGQNDAKVPQPNKKTQEQSASGDIKSSSRSKSSEEDKVKKENALPSLAKSNFESKRSGQAGILSAQSISKYTESLKEIISKEFSEDVLPLEIVKLSVSKTPVQQGLPSSGSIKEPLVRDSLASKTSIKSDDKWYKDSANQSNLNSSSNILQQKSIRENQEKKILELHEKHLEEISKLRYGENVSLKGINRPVSLINEALSNTAATKEIATINPPCKSSSFDTSTDTVDKSTSGRNKPDALSSHIANSAVDNSSKKEQGTDAAVSKQTPDNSTKAVNRKVTETQQFSFSSYLIASRKDSVEEKDVPSQPKPVEEKTPVKVDIPKKVHFPDEFKNAVDNQPLVDEKLPRASITNESQSADLEITSESRDATRFHPKVNTVSILKRSSGLKDENKNEISLRLPEDDSTSTLLAIPDEVILNTTNFTVSSVPSTTTTTPGGGTKISSSTSVTENNYQIPLRPPRGEKPARRKRSLSASDAMRHQMSDQRVSKDGIQKDIIQNRKTSQNQTKNQPTSNQQLVQQLQQKHQYQQQLQQQEKKLQLQQQQQKQEESKPLSEERQQELQKLQSQQHKQQQQQQQLPHNEKQKDHEFQPKNNTERKEDKPTREATPPKPPQPPSRVNKPNINTHETPEKFSSVEENKPEGILVTACKVAEEDQILRLLRDLSKTCRFDVVFVNQVDKSGRSALSHACSNGFARVVEFLTSQPDIDLNLIDNEGNTPLHYASQGGHVEIVSHLVNTCSRQVDLDVRNSLGFTPLMKAALQGRTKIAKILLFAGASPHLRDFGRGFCAVEWAKYTGRDNCGDLIESVQRSCSSHIKERWTSDPEFKLFHSGSNSSLSHCQYSAAGSQDNKDSWLKHKIKKAFHKSESKKEFSVASNLSNLAQCVSSPLVPCQSASSEPTVPKVQITEVSAPDCYLDPDYAEETLNPDTSEELASEDDFSTNSNSSSPDAPHPPSKIPFKTRKIKGGGTSGRAEEIDNSSC